jgi:hypothetical protein
MTSANTDRSVSRRTALAGLGAGSLGLAFTARGRETAAQDTAAMAAHPIVGVWQVTTPGGPAIAVFSADGVNIQAVTATAPGQAGVTYVSTEIGTWEPVSDRGVHFTSCQLFSDANGAFTGTLTIDGYPVVSEDGQTFLDDQSQVVITVRDAAGAILQQMPGAGAPPVTGIRMGVGAPGFPDGPGATPTA